MNNTNLYITLGVLCILVVEFLRHKRPYGLTAMACVVILTLTGVIDVSTAFSGFSNFTTIMVATMLVVAGAINKTSLARRVKEKMNVMRGKKGIVLLLLIAVFTAVLTQLMDMIAVMSVLLVVIESMDDERDMSHSRMIFMVAALNAAWFGRIPIGMGAALPMQTNALFEGLIGDKTEYLVGMFDLLKIGFIPTICLTAYSLLAWKLIPKHKIDSSAFSANAQREQVELSPYKEKVILTVFTLTMFAFFFSSKLGLLVYVVPVVSVLALLYTQVITPQELATTIGSDIVFMCAGMLVISSAMSKSGAGEFVGNLVLSILGNDPSSLKVIIVFAVATTIMTNFLSNFGTMAVMIPIACSAALAGGMNPKAVVLVVNCAATLAIGFPTGCAAGTFAYAVGKHDPIKVLKFTLPYLLIGIASLVFSANIFFPVY